MNLRGMVWRWPCKLPSRHECGIGSRSSARCSGGPSSFILHPSSFPMNLWLGLLVGLKEIWAHKFRSILTMLGVILGVASLLSMFSLTAGIAKGMREYMQQVGGIERVGVLPQEPPEEQQLFADTSPGRT